MRLESGEASVTVAEFDTQRAPAFVEEALNHPEDWGVSGGAEHSEAPDVPQTTGAPAAAGPRILKCTEYSGFSGKPTECRQYTYDDSNGKAGYDLYLANGDVWEYSWSVAFTYDGQGGIQELRRTVPQYDGSVSEEVYLPAISRSDRVTLAYGSAAGQSFFYNDQGQCVEERYHSGDSDSGLVYHAMTFEYDSQGKIANAESYYTAMMDGDGVLRHYLLYFTHVPSMALVQRYQDGLELPPVSAQGFWYLPYCKAPDSFETRSIADVLEGADHARQAYGVEYQANAVQAMLYGNYKREAGTPEIVSELMSSGPAALKLGGKKCDIAVLFVDIRGFTAMSESLEPERVVEILNQYLTLTTKCIMDHHGTLDKFVEDCTMAFWNAPLPQEDYLLLACRAAMAMAEGAKPLAETLQKEYGHTVSWGSAPRPAPNYMAYGGNTVCTSLEHGGHLVVLDAGTGLSALGASLAVRKDVAHLDILLSYFHIDHVMGLYFFQPLFNPDMEIHFHGGLGLRENLRVLMGAPFWPLGLRDSPARLAFHGPEWAGTALADTGGI